MSTDREKYAAQEIAPVELNEGGAIVLETFSPTTGPHVSINFYDEEGGLGGYLSSISPRHRAQILALGRAIVEALHPVPDPPQHFAPWGAVATSCGATVPRGLTGTTDRRDETTCDDCSARFTEPAPEPVSELGTVEYVTAEPHLPLDVEIRSIALDAAVRAIGDSGDDVVTHARAIERFLVGGEEEAAVPRWTPGQTLTVEDLDALPVGARVIDRDGDRAERRDSEDARTWRRNGRFDYSSARIAAYAPVTLVSLP